MCRINVCVKPSDKFAREFAGWLISLIECPKRETANIRFHRGSCSCEPSISAACLSVADVVASLAKGQLRCNEIASLKR